MGIILIDSIIIGLIAGVLAKFIMPDDVPGGFIITIILGIAGALVGGFLSSLLEIGGGGLTSYIISGIIVATIGAILLLAIYRGIAKGRSGRRIIGTEARRDHVSPRGQSSTGRSSEEYDVFISYRRERGVEAARLIANGLKDKRLRPYIDVDELGAGHFDQALLETITNTPNFVILLTPQALDQLVEEEDWLRQEISQAIKTNRNIVPVMWPDFQFPEPQTLPEDIRALRTYQGVGYSYEFFDAMISRLLKYLR